jgi:hypothetical protein
MGNPKCVNGHTYTWSKNMNIKYEDLNEKLTNKILLCNITI